MSRVGKRRNRGKEMVPSHPPRLSHACNYFPTTHTVSPSFLSAPSRTLVEDSVGNTPVSPKTCSSSGRAEHQDCVPHKGGPRATWGSAPPHHSPEKNTQGRPPWGHIHPSQSQQQAKRREQGTLPEPPHPENPSPFSSPEHSQSSPLAIPQGLCLKRNYFLIQNSGIYVTISRQQCPLSQPSLLLQLWCQLCALSHMPDTLITT